MLVVLIGASCLALLVIRHRRQKAKTLERTVTHAEDFPGTMPHHQRSSHSSQRWTGGFGSRAAATGRDHRGANNYSYDEHHHDPTETSSYASYVSGETLRSSSLRQLDPLDPDTLLRLDPSLRSGGSDEEEDDEESNSRFGHSIADEDLYHPSVSPTLSSRQSHYSRETIDQWDVPPDDARQSDRTLAMPTLSSNDDDASYADSDTLPTSRDGDRGDDGADADYLAVRSGTTSRDTDFCERIDQVPSGDDDDTSTMFDPSTIATASCVSSRPTSLRSTDLLLGRRSRDSVDTGYSVDMLFAKLRRKRGIDPEPSHSNEEGEGSPDQMKGPTHADELSSNGGVLS